jgi:molybdopterin/thiamine biosynthesis adenylyltransferase
MALSNLWCKRHPQREAAAKCPGCAGFFCQECVVEHDERYLCQSCISKELTPADESYSWKRWLILTLGALGGFLCITSVFYIAGKILLAIPSHYHHGDLW